VQILVVVATIQMRTLKTEVGKVSMRTAFDHGLVVPKRWDRSVWKECGSPCLLSKGEPVKILALGRGYCAVTQVPSVKARLAPERVLFSF
jgi:hypothetical protein